MSEKSNSLLKNFPKKLKSLRLKREWSQKTTGNKIGVSAQIVSKYELGMICPPAETLIRIAQVYEVSIDYLLRDEENIIVNKITNQKLIKCINEIINLSKEEEEILIDLMDAYIKRSQFRQLMES